jgi:hypothetical protein
MRDAADALQTVIETSRGDAGSAKSVRARAHALAYRLFAVLRRKPETTHRQPAQPATPDEPNLRPQRGREIPPDQQPGGGPPHR